MSRAFPLQWPEGWPRTPVSRRHRNYAYKVTPDRALSDLIDSLRKLGIVRGSVVVSTNVPTRRDGLPYADARVPEDSGVAVYWASNAHGERVIACDRWQLVHENIRAIGLAVDGLRMIDRAGASQILQRAFSAFGALPASPEAAPRARPWWDVLELPESAINAFSIPVVVARYRELAAKAHPDKGGSEAAMVELNAALEQARAHYGKSK